MAIDYNTDILPLFVTKVVTDEPYASVPAVLQDDEPERRILTTIEVIRSHMEVLGSRTEAKLLQMVLSSLMEKVGSGGFVYTPEQLISLGNICNPTFPAGASLDITLDGTTVSPVSATGGDIDTVVSELNTSLGAASSAETSDVTPIDDTPDGLLSGRHFFISDPTDDYYVWMSPDAAVGQVIDVDVDAASFITGGERFHISSTTIDYYTWYDKRRAEISGLSAVADVAGSLGGTSFLLNGIDTAPDGIPKAFYVWYDVPIKEETNITVVADVAGSLGGTHWLINSAGDATAYYVWYDVTARAEVTDITVVADVAGSLDGTHWLLKSATDATSYYVWHEFADVAEITNIDVVSDVEGSLGGTHWLINSAGDATAYYVWYDFAAAAEVTEITVPADTEGSLGGTHWLINSAGDVTAYYVWYDFAAVAEVTDVVTPAASTFSAAGAGDHWTVNSGGDATAYYVWYDVDSGNSDPAPGGTGIEVDVAAADASTVVATKTASAIDALGDFGAPAPGASTVTITNAATGFTTDAADVSAGVTPTITTQGSATQVDPTPGGTGITVTIATNDTTTLVAEATFAAIDGVGDFGAVDAGALVTVTNAATGFTTDASNVDAGVAVEVTTEGASTATDPAPGGTGITVTILPSDFSSAVATATRAAIGALGDFGTSGTEETVTVTNAATGFTTDASEVDAGVTVTVTTQGSAASVDPAPGGTGITVGVGTNDTALDIAEATAAAITAFGDFGAVDAGAVVTVTNAAVGATTDAADVDAGVGVSVTTQGITASVDPAPGGTGITVGVVGDAIVGSVAEATSAAIGALGDFGATDVGAIVTVTNAAGGATTDASEVDAGVFVEVTTQGTDGSVDPASAANSITVTLVEDDSAGVVAEKTVAAISGEAEFGAVDGGGIGMTITNAFGGTVTDISDVDTGFSEVSVSIQGLGANTDDPAPAGRTEIKVTIGSIDSASVVAAATEAAVGGIAAFSTTDSEETVTITNIVGGVVLSPFDSSTSEFSPSTIIIPGAGPGGTDPGPFAGRTTVTVSYTPGDVASEIAFDISGELDGLGDFAAEVSGSIVEITNAESGDAIPDISAETSGFTVVVTAQGTGTSAVELFKTPAGKIGVRNTVGSENISFTIADGSGGILTPAGMPIGAVLARPEAVAAASIDDAIGSYVAAPRDASL